MGSRWLRLGIRTQIMIIVVISAVLTTAVTLLIANTSISNYGSQQQDEQADRNMSVALSVLSNQFGRSISISSNNQMVIDAPNKQGGLSLSNNYGKVYLNTDDSYVQSVRSLLKVDVSIYQCVNQNIELVMENNKLSCHRISTTFQHYNKQDKLESLVAENGRSVGFDIYTKSNPAAILGDNVISAMELQSLTAKTNLSPKSENIVERVHGLDYMVAYRTILDPQGNMIGVLAVAESQDALNQLLNDTVFKLLLGGVIIMIAGAVLSVIVASTISSTLQNAATQLSSSSSQLSSIAEQQTGGSRQQVWAINAINQAISTLQENAGLITQRTDHLAVTGAQVFARHNEVSRDQYESIVSYMTQQIREVNIVSHQQSATVDRMSSAMQAVIEIADQVAGNSLHTSESARRLDIVVGELKRLVSGNLRLRKRLESGKPVVTRNPSAPFENTSTGGKKSPKRDSRSFTNPSGGIGQ
jgi:hypothetical protein